MNNCVGGGGGGGGGGGRGGGGGGGGGGIGGAAGGDLSTPIKKKTTFVRHTVIPYHYTIKHTTNLDQRCHLEIMYTAVVVVKVVVF